MATIPTPEPTPPTRPPEEIHAEIVALDGARDGGAEGDPADTLAWLTLTAARRLCIADLWWELGQAAATAPTWAQAAVLLAHASAGESARWWAREAAVHAVQSTAWVATARRGVEAHRVLGVVEPGAIPATVCGRSTRTGVLTTPAEAGLRWQATWCPRCWPTTPQVGPAATPGGGL